MKRFPYTIDRDARLTSPIRSLIPFDTYFSLRALQARLKLK